VSDEPTAPLPVLVPYSRFQEVQQRRHPVVPPEPSPTATEQPAATGAEPTDAFIRTILVET
jgi:hypothetical protein